MSEKTPLNNSLHELREELHAIEGHTEESKRVADGLLEDIEPLLDRPGDLSFEHHRLLMQSLSESLECFRLTHPRISAILNSIIQSLQSIGI